jgi:low affinity Fe/Cu permease
MKIINANVHAVLDYLTVIFLWISPSLFNFSRPVSTFTYILGAIHLLLTISTNYKYGILKFIPFPTHGTIELILGIVLIITPWLLNFTNNTDCYYYSALALVIFITYALTDFSSAKLL